MKCNSDWIVNLQEAESAANYLYHGGKDRSKRQETLNVDFVETLKGLNAIVEKLSAELAELKQRSH